MQTSIVIPCYNEGKRIQPLLDRAMDRIQSLLEGTFELVFVNDGSTDNTVEVLKKAFNGRPGMKTEIIGYRNNKGKGNAVKEGVLHAKGGKIIVMDADFSIDLDEIPKALKELDRFDIVVGSKKHSLAKSVKHQKLPRRIMGKGFTMLTNAVLGLNFTDITCGFKGFKSAPAKNIFGRQMMNGWAYDSETLFLAKKLGYTSLEMPVKWHHIDGSKVSPVYDAVKSLRDLTAIIFNYYSGGYERKSR